jgi:hypothetical protein
MIKTEYWELKEGKEEKISLSLNKWLTHDQNFSKGTSKIG